MRCDIDLIYTALELALNSKLFGQHLASRIILKTVTRHMENPDPEKPLVLSLHGLAGTGKNLMSRFIAESIYKNGMKSKFVHLFIATSHFLHKAELETYKVITSSKFSTFETQNLQKYMHSCITLMYST